MELQWVRHNAWHIRDRDYYAMCEAKTAWYTAATPCRVGALIGAPEIDAARLRSLTAFGLRLGLAFQIQDDILNLTADEAAYGKEINGDLIEGKRTLILITTFRRATSAERTKIRRITAKTRARKTKDDVRFLRQLIGRYDVLATCARASRRFASQALQIMDSECSWIANDEQKAFLREMANYVITRPI